MTSSFEHSPPRSAAFDSTATVLARETPDIETSSDDYARRFAGAAGEYFLSVQTHALDGLMEGLFSSSVLEVGGGHGQLVPALLRHGCKLTMFGSDEITHARVRASHPNEPISYATGNVLNLPYADRSFDVVVAVRLISHIDAWETLLKEFCRVARYSVIVDYPSWRSLNALTPMLYAFKKSVEGNTREYASFYPSQLATVFERHNFVVSSSYSQFFLPMFLHRGLAGARWLQTGECICRSLGWTKLFGSPVLMRADRSPRRVRIEDQASSASVASPSIASSHIE